MLLVNTISIKRGEKRKRTEDSIENDRNLMIKTSNSNSFNSNNPITFISTPSNSYTPLNSILLSPHPDIVKPLPLRPFNSNSLQLELFPSSQDFTSNTLPIKSRELELLEEGMNRTRVEILELEVEEKELEDKKVKDIEENEKVKEVIDLSKDDIILTTSWLTMTDQTGNNFIQIEPLSTRFDATQGCFEWRVSAGIENTYYLIIIPLSHISFLSFSNNSITFTLISPPLLLSKPIIHNNEITWSSISSLPFFTSPGNLSTLNNSSTSHNTDSNFIQELSPSSSTLEFHHLELSNSNESQLRFWNLRFKFPLIKFLINLNEINNMTEEQVEEEEEENSKYFTSNSNVPIYSPLDYNFTTSTTSSSISTPFPTSSSTTSIYQITPPPSPPLHSFTTPTPTEFQKDYHPQYPSNSNYQFPSAEELTYNISSTNIPLPPLIENQYQFPPSIPSYSIPFLPPPPPSNSNSSTPTLTSLESSNNLKYDYCYLGSSYSDQEKEEEEEDIDAEGIEDDNNDDEIWWPWE